MSFSSTSAALTYTRFNRFLLRGLFIYHLLVLLLHLIYLHLQISITIHIFKAGFLKFIFFFSTSSVFACTKEFYSYLYSEFFYQGVCLYIIRLKLRSSLFKNYYFFDCWRYFLLHGVIKRQIQNPFCKNLFLICQQNQTRNVTLASSMCSELSFGNVRKLDKASFPYLNKAFQKTHNTNNVCNS